jgi:nucleoside-diphosphate-sugar epimerase
MKVFITGATGFVGSAVVQELINNGHQVLGLARSSTSAEKLTAAGAEVLYGDLEDMKSLQRGAAAADAVIHCGFIHDFARFSEVCKIDKLAILAIGEVLVGTDKPFIITSGTALVSPGQVATEHIIPSFNPALPRASEQAADEVAALGVRAAVVRLAPSVHGLADHGFIQTLVNIAGEQGCSAYIADGLNRWNAVHRFDAARLYRLILENATPGARFHAVAEEELRFKAIAEAIGLHLNIPVRSIPADKADAHFGWISGFVAIDCPTSSKLTKERLNWKPEHQSLLTDIEQGVYSNSLQQ